MRERVELTSSHILDENSEKNYGIQFHVEGYVLI
jgi:hypothetical protein